jgi:hypothetical protein
MVYMYGAHWDYDRWVCMSRDGLVLCPGEIELDVTTMPEGEE